jgi:hypothetical protein
MKLKKTTRSFADIQPNIHINDANWPRPIPLDDAPCMADDFSLDLLPPAGKLLVRVISNQSATDSGYAAASLLTFLSGGLSNIYAVQPEKTNNSWILPVNLSGLLVGEASVRKSRAFRPIQSFVKQAEQALFNDYVKIERQLISDFEAKKKLNISRHNLAQRKISESVSIESKDPAKAEELLAEAKEILKQIVPEGEAPSAPTLIINDTTEPGLHSLKTREFHCHYYVRDEASPLFLDTMPRSQAKFKSFLIEAMDGDNDYRRNLKTENAGNAKSPKLCIFGTTQPSKITSYLSDVTNQGLSNDGFFNRFQLLIFPNKNESLDLSLNTKADDIMEVFSQLFKFMLAKSNLEKTEVKVLNFENSAEELFSQFKKESAEKLKAHAGTPLESHVGKYTGLVPCISLILELLEKVKPNIKAMPKLHHISRKNLEMAIDWAEYLESHAKKVFGMVDPTRAVAQLVLKERKKLGESFTVREVYECLPQPYYRNKEITLVALGYLSTLHYVRKKGKATTNSGGRPRNEWEFNPILFKS